MSATKTPPTPASDRALIDDALRKLAGNFMVPASAAQAMTAAVRVIDRLSARVAALENKGV